MCVCVCVCICVCVCGGGGGGGLALKKFKWSARAANYGDDEVFWKYDKNIDSEKLPPENAEFHG